MKTWVALVLLVVIWLGIELIHQDTIKQKAFSYAQRLTGGRGILNMGSGTPLNPTGRAVALNKNVRYNVDIRDNGTSKLVQWDINQPLPFGDKEFDVVFASHILEHVENWEFALAEAKRVADHVVVVLPPVWGLSNWLHLGHKRIFSASTAQGLADEQVAVFQ